MPPIQAKTVASFAKKLLFAAKQKHPGGFLSKLKICPDVFAWLEAGTAP